MNRKITFLLALFVILGVFYFYIGVKEEGAPAPHMEEELEDSMMESGHTHTEGESDAHSHAKLYEIPTGIPTPTIDFELVQDDISGHNLRIWTTNFIFVPENINGENILGEGHAHIYLNGEKLARVYGPWHHMASLPLGTHEFAVSLNAHDHAEYAVEGERVRLTKTVTITK